MQVRFRRRAQQRHVCASLGPAPAIAPHGGGLPTLKFLFSPFVRFSIFVVAYPCALTRFLGRAGMLTPMWVLCLLRMRNTHMRYANNLHVALHRFQALCKRLSYSTHSGRKTSVTTIPFVCVGGVRGRPSKPGQAWAWRRERQVAIVSA